MNDKETTTTLTLRIPTSLKLRIEIESNKDCRTINSWVNKALKEYIEMQKEKG